MSFEIVMLSAMTVMGVELQTTYKNGECFSAIPAFWQEAGKSGVFAQIPHQAKPGEVLAVYTNYSSDFSLTSGHYSMILGSPVTDTKNIPQGMVVKNILQSRYAVFTAKGPFAAAVGGTWMEIWQNKELQLQRTFTNDFEWYDANSTDDENSIVKIYVAIK